eukprot:8542313-Pyramimonas_sp.AAC.1
MLKFCSTPLVLILQAAYASRTGPNALSVYASLLRTVAAAARCQAAKLDASRSCLDKCWAMGYSFLSSSWSPPLST